MDSRNDTTTSIKHVSCIASKTPDLSQTCSPQGIFRFSSFLKSNGLRYISLFLFFLFFPSPSYPFIFFSCFHSPSYPFTYLHQLSFIFTFIHLPPSSVIDLHIIIPICLYLPLPVSMVSLRGENEFVPHLR